MHIAKSADVHQNVEAELLTGSEGSQHLIVPPAMAQARINDFPAPRFTDLFYSPANLAVRV
jgi:hypothetical protein